MAGSTYAAPSAPAASLDRTIIGFCLITSLFHGGITIKKLKNLTTRKLLQMCRTPIWPTAILRLHCTRWRTDRTPLLAWRRVCLNHQYLNLQHRRGQTASIRTLAPTSRQSFRLPKKQENRRAISFSKIPSLGNIGSSSDIDQRCSLGAQNTKLSVGGLRVISIRQRPPARPVPPT